MKKEFKIMKRREFIKIIALSFVATNLIFDNNLSANNVFNNNGKQIIEFYCSGGADFRYLFAPTEEGEYKNLYFEKQNNILIEDDYEHITIDNKDIMIRKDAQQLKKSLLEGEIAVISNVWFSPNRDHNYSSKKALYGKNEPITPFNGTDSSWIGKIAGYTNKNTIQLSQYYSYACNIDKEEFNNDSQMISAINTRPFGIQNNNNSIDNALKRFYNNFHKNNSPIAKHFVSEEQNLINFSNKINNKLKNIQRVITNTNNKNLNDMVSNLFDTIDTRDILNSSNYYLSYGSWDFHRDFRDYDRFTNLFGDENALYTMISELKKRNLWNDTVIIINSEFGRQIKQNGSSGKDHGHGNLLFVAGGSINGGIYGDMFPNSEIEKFKSYRGYDIEGKTNGVSIYAKIADFISQGLGDTIYKDRNKFQIEQEFELFKSNT
jgi:uncharacterized protein (DUF1501 family)